MNGAAPGGGPGAARGRTADDVASVARAHDDPVRRQMRREKARRVMVLASIKAHLAEQPSRAAVRAAARQWEREVWAAAEEVLRELAA